jgi:hypothetical protein
MSSAPGGLGDDESGEPPAGLPWLGDGNRRRDRLHAAVRRALARGRFGVI